LKKNLSQKRAGRVAQGVGPEFTTPVSKNKHKQTDKQKVWKYRGFYV
jgi:hypothetical protein